MNGEREGESKQNVGQRRDGVSATAPDTGSSTVKHERWFFLPFLFLINIYADSILSISRNQLLASP